MKKSYNTPILFELQPGGEGEFTGDGSGVGPNMMTFSDWLDHNPEGTQADYEAWCADNGWDPIYP